MEFYTSLWSARCSPYMADMAHLGDKKNNTHPHLQSTTNGLPRMRTHPKTYQQCPETQLFLQATLQKTESKYTVSVRQCCTNNFTAKRLANHSLMFTNLFSNFLPSAWTWKISVQGSSRTCIWEWRAVIRGKGLLLVPQNTSLSFQTVPVNLD